MTPIVHALLGESPAMKVLVVSLMNNLINVFLLGLQQLITRSPHPDGQKAVMVIRLHTLNTETEVNL
jgi:hypothetical protein